MLYNIQHLCTIILDLPYHFPAGTRRDGAAWMGTNETFQAMLDCHIGCLISVCSSFGGVHGVRQRNPLASDRTDITFVYQTMMRQTVWFFFFVLFGLLKM